MTTGTGAETRAWHSPRVVGHWLSFVVPHSEQPAAFTQLAGINVLRAMEVSRNGLLTTSPPGINYLSS